MVFLEYSWVVESGLNDIQRQAHFLCILLCSGLYVCVFMLCVTVCVCVCVCLLVTECRVCDCLFVCVCVCASGNVACLTVCAWARVCVCVSVNVVHVTTCECAYVHVCELRVCDCLRVRACDRGLSLWLSGQQRYSPESRPPCSPELKATDLEASRHANRPQI